MTVFGIGTLELVLILLLLILIFGPDRIVEVGTWLGRSYRKLTGVTSEINQQVMQVRKAVDANAGLSGVTSPLQEAAREIQTAKKALSRDLLTSPANNETVSTAKQMSESPSQSGELPEDEPAIAPVESEPALQRKTPPEGRQEPAHNTQANQDTEAG